MAEQDTSVRRRSRDLLAALSDVPENQRTWVRDLCTAKYACASASSTAPWDIVIIMLAHAICKALMFGAKVTAYINCKHMQFSAVLGFGHICLIFERTTDALIHAYMETAMHVHTVCMHTHCVVIV